MPAGADRYHGAMHDPSRDNPTRILDHTVRLDGPTTSADLIQAARVIHPEWGCPLPVMEFDEEPIRIDVIGGGITNALFRLSGAGRPTVLVRVYGHNTEVVIDREAENALFARLSRLGFAPPYHGRFRNGRVEGFLHGHRALEPHELRHHQPAIAARLAELHAIQPATPEPRLWHTLGAWMRTAGSLRFQGRDALRAEALELGSAAEELHTLERRYREELLPTAHSGGRHAAVRAVLAHNDLLAGNILLEEQTGAVRFIDYEYGACAPAAFDIANHLCEYAGFDSYFAAHFPFRAAREAFVAHYLTARGGPAGSGAVVDFTDIVDFFVRVNHLWWGSWAVVQAAHSAIDFDFLEYARLRLAGLHWHNHQGDLAS